MRLTLLLLVAALFLAGCASRRSCCRPRRCTPPTPGGALAGAVPAPATRFDRRTRAAPETRRLYRPDTGADVRLAAAAAEWEDADIIAFGELHGNLVGAEAQLALLKTLARQRRPIALAMEFFERDTQADVDAYLKGELDEEAFRKKTKRNRAYDATHGPLIQFCREKGIPVIAANAPRRLVTGYRKSDEDYETYLAGLSEEDRGFLPEETDVLEDEYQEKFLALMGSAKGPSFFRSQSLWDDAMAEAMVEFRAEHPAHRVLLIVGGFHVERGLGTITKYRNRRGKDDVRILLMKMSQDPKLSPVDDEMGSADVLLKIPAPKPKARALPPGHPKPGGVS